MKVKILVATIVFLIIGVSVYLTYNKPHRNPENEISLTISAETLFNHFENNEDSANALYLDKVLSITGTVTDISLNQENMPVVTLASHNTLFGVRCTMKSGVNLNLFDTVSIKGICTGFLSDVIITNATIEQNKK